MSCWMLNDEFIATVAEGISQAARTKIWIEPGTFENCGIKGFSGYFYFDERKLAAKLKSMNVAAYNGRYRRSPKSETETDRFPDTTATAKALNDDTTGEAWGAFLKMLDCFMYQCAEDPVYDSDDYRSLEKIRNSIRDIIISRNKGYSEAQWGYIPDILKAC